MAGASSSESAPPSAKPAGAVALSSGDVATSSCPAVCGNKAALLVGIDNHTTFVCFFTPD